jgi:hypothetical protein
VPTKSNREANRVLPPTDTAGEAVIYAGKQDWKNLPGNRYSPAELREMERNWDIKIKIPQTVQTRRAD